MAGAEKEREREREREGDRDRERERERRDSRAAAQVVGDAVDMKRRQRRLGVQTEEEAHRWEGIALSISSLASLASLSFLSSFSSFSSFLFSSSV